MMNSIFNLLIAPWTTHVVFTAIRLKLFTNLADKTKTVEEISSA